MNNNSNNLPLDLVSIGGLVVGVVDTVIDIEGTAVVVGVADGPIVDVVMDVVVV